MKMNVNVNGQDFTATLENNSAVDALELHKAWSYR